MSSDSQNQSNPPALKNAIQQLTQKAPIDGIKPVAAAREQDPHIAEAQRIPYQQRSRPIGPKERELLELSKAIRSQQHKEEAETKAPLGELAVLAQTLNSESDELNATIQTINEKLRALNFGVEVWCKGSDGDYGFARVDD